MKLLICTQKISANDPVLGFFHSWIWEFSRHCEKVTVICLEKGDYDLPSNVKILSLGKEEKKMFRPEADQPLAGNGYIARWLYGWRFCKYIFAKRHDYDVVLVHMNPEYFFLGGLFWRLTRKKIGLWYVHRQVNFKLKVAKFFSHHLFSVSESSINIRSKKLHFLGHGIDTEQFKCDYEKKTSDIIKIISVGRITKIKNLDVLVRAVGLLRGRIDNKFVVELIGEPVTADDTEYKKELVRLIDDFDLAAIIKFAGAKKHEELPEIYCGSDLHINLAPTGGLDKAMLEAMAAGIPVIATNNSFAETLGAYADKLLFKYGDSNDLAQKMALVLNSNAKSTVGNYLRQQIIDNHNLSKLVKRIIDILQYGKN